MAVLLGTLTYALIEARGAGWTSPLVVASLLAAAGALAWLVPYERRRDESLIDPRLFRSAPFSGATATAVFAFAALSGFLFANTVYLQGDLGLSPLDAGLRLLPMAALSLLCPPLSGRIVGSRGPRVPLLIAGAGIASSGALAALVTRSTHPSQLLLSLMYALFGLGFGFVNAPVTDTAVVGLPSAQAGVAASIAATSRQVGAALGIALIGAAAASGARSAAWWAITGCGLAVLALATVTSGRRPAGSAQRVKATAGPPRRRAPMPARGPRPRGGRPRDAETRNLDKAHRPGGGAASREQRGGVLRDASQRLSGPVIRAAGCRPLSVQHPRRAEERHRLPLCRVEQRSASCPTTGADVRQQVGLSMITEFENFSLFKPSAHNLPAPNAMLDQVIAWSTALTPLRTASPVAA